MSKHTNGPWVVMNGNAIVGPLGGDSGDGTKCDKSDGWQVAEVYQTESFVGGVLTELGRDCVKANARLISAAPDLLEALECMLENCPAIDPSGEEAEAKARSAIAKAKGEQA